VRLSRLLTRSRGLPVRPEIGRNARFGKDDVEVELELAGPRLDLLLLQGLYRLQLPYHLVSGGPGCQEQSHDAYGCRGEDHGEGQGQEEPQPDREHSGKRQPLHDNLTRRPARSRRGLTELHTVTGMLGSEAVAHRLLPAGRVYPAERNLRDVNQGSHGSHGQLLELDPVVRRPLRENAGRLVGALERVTPPLTLTGRAFATGTVLALAAIPRALFMLVGGALTDRLSRPVLMLGKETGAEALPLPRVLPATEGALQQAA
jgi:hypothetical protein